MPMLEEVKILKEEVAEEGQNKGKEWHLDERRFEEVLKKGEVLKRHDDRNNKLDAYGRLLHHMICNVVIPNVGHKSSITNTHSFVMLALHEHRRMNFGYMAIEHMLANQMSSTKCLPYGCFLTKVFKYFVLNLVRVGDASGAGKIHNKHTFKRMGFAKNEEGMLVRGGQDDDDEETDEDNEGNEGQEAINVDEEESEEEPEEETYRREMRQKKRQEQVEEDQSSRSMTQIMDMVASSKTVKEQTMNKRSVKGNLQRSKRSLKTTRVYEDEVIKLNTLKTRRIVRGIL
ncbi:hypothetical protein M9H77_21427 [Catharanthus roseus]|uniref:Uncharacterized protein n=1 Tax=Catharanthus roseus TaxID=4058 RepID=A0ACC0ANE7_CATRO|nr:hypothetical protein M9H77_21427 [Catharanthus roseus]